MCTTDRYTCNVTFSLGQSKRILYRSRDERVRIFPAKTMRVYQDTVVIETVTMQ